MKRVIAALLSMLLLLPLSACWSYRGLNEMTIVSGAAIDFDIETGIYHVSCEIVDVTGSNKETGAKAKLVEADGKTVFDAVRNAKKKLISKLYWGNTQVLILGKGLTEKGVLDSVVTWFNSNSECRETVDLIVSREKTARDLLTIPGLDNSIVSYEIRKIVDEDAYDTASLRPAQIYRIYNIMRSPGLELSLPAFENVKNNNQTVVEASGQAVFKNDKLSGFLTSEQTKYLLFAVDEIQGGILTLSSNHSSVADTSLEISKNRTSRSFSVENGKITVKLQTDTDVYLNHAEEGADLLNETKIQTIKDDIQKDLKNKIENLIGTVQQEYNSDILGFGNMIYKENPKLWEQVGPHWDEEFKNLKVEVQCTVNILNTSFLNHD